jgi:hypothetical protein
MAEVLSYEQAQAKLAEISAAARPALPAAQDLASAALDQVKQVKDRELKLGNNIRRITLRPENEPDTVIQVVEQVLDKSTGSGRMWIRKVRITQDQSGEQHVIPSAKIELPNTTTFTEADIRHLTANRSSVDVAAQLKELTAQIPTAKCVSDSEFVIPQKLYRKPKESRVKHAVEAVGTRVESVKPRVAEVIEIFNRTRRRTAAHKSVAA